MQLPDLDKLPATAMLRAEQVAAVLQVSTHTLQTWRLHKPDHPLKWTRVGKSPRYSVGAVRAFLGMNSAAAE
jgi:hypothetical protein